MPAALCAIAVVLASAESASGQAQPVPALLPDKTAVRPGDPMPIDGMWRIDPLSARVRIEGGRIYALDPWVHLLIWQVMPGMVVTRNLERTAPGEYTGDDLPNLGRWVGVLNDNQQLVVDIAGTLGPLHLTLTALQPDDPGAFRRERAAQSEASGGADD